MPGNTATGSVKRVTLEVDLPDAGDWSAPKKVPLGLGGRLYRSTFRAPDGSSVTEVDLLVWEGPAEGYPAGFDPYVEVPHEDRVFRRTEIAVVGDDLDADDDIWLDITTVPADFHTPHYLDRILWAAVRTNTGTAQEGAVWSLRAIDTVG